MLAMMVRCLSGFSGIYPVRSPGLRELNRCTNQCRSHSYHAVGRQPICRSKSTENREKSPDEHNEYQVEFFTTNLAALRDSITPEVDSRLARIASSIPCLGPDSRVLDVGAGDGALIPHLQRLGVQDILAVDICPAMIQALQKRVMDGDILGKATTLGNDKCVRTWVGDVVDLPTYQGPFDVAFFNAVFGNLSNPHLALIKTSFLIRPESYIVISHPMGRKWHKELSTSNPALVPHPLPDKEALEKMVFDLPVQLVDLVDDDDLYLALLQIPKGYAVPGYPIKLSGTVTTGFGRGSRQLGVPTANLPPAPLADKLRDMPSGVYFGWARVNFGDDQNGDRADDSQAHKMVMNVGRRPTFEDTEPELTVEIHIMHNFGSDFYGLDMRALVLGYLRPEIKFSGLPELLSRIRQDIGVAASQLNSPQWAPFCADESLNFD